ncbi:MAG: ferrous iron transport protein A [Microcystaceae cyanobacterium]
MNGENMEQTNRHRHGQNWRFSFFSESEDAQSPVEPTEPSNSSYSLSQATIGESIWVVGFQGKGGMNRLLGMGLTPGVELQVVSSQPSGSVLVAIQDNRIGIGAGMAHKIMVSDHPLNHQQENKMTNTEAILLKNLKEGTKGRVLGYNKVGRGYKGKLLSMGLTPKTEFEVVRVAPLGDPVEILVRGFHLSLRKQEADALIIELI